MKKNNEYKNIEELFVLLESINLINIKEFLNQNKYLLEFNIFDIAYTISQTVEKTKDYNKTKEYLLKTKFAIIE